MAEPDGEVAGAAGEPGVLRTLAVALAVCGACALLLAGSVVALRPLQAQNRQAERERRVRALVAELPGMDALLEARGDVVLELRAVELASGEYAPAVDPELLLGYDAEERRAEPLPRERDPAGIGELPRYAPVYEVRRDGGIDTLILPVHGRGYLSTIQGYLAVAGDGNTVRGITFTEHEETPGLGAEIESPAWQALWQGKSLRDDSGEVRIRVVQEPPATDSPEARYRVQGISGATKTSDGVTALVRFWVGPEGFGPYLERIRQGGDP